MTDPSHHLKFRALSEAVDHIFDHTKYYGVCPRCGLTTDDYDEEDGALHVLAEHIMEDGCE